MRPMRPESAILPDVTLDLRGMRCPGPVLGTQKLVAELYATPPHLIARAKQALSAKPQR